MAITLKPFVRFTSFNFWVAALDDLHRAITTVPCYPLRLNLTTLPHPLIILKWSISRGAFYLSFAWRQAVAWFSVTPYVPVTVVWHDILCHNKVNCALIFTFYMPRKSRFFTWWPWPLTYDLEYRTRPRYCPDTSLHQFSCLYVKPFGRESVHRQTDRRTGPKTLPRPLTREVNINSVRLFLQQFPNV